MKNLWKRIWVFFCGGKCNCGNETHDKDTAGNYQCIFCQHKEDLQKRKDAEMIYTCPIDGEQMTKEDIFGIIINKCPICHGTWLDNNRLKGIIKTFNKRKQ